MQSARKIDKRKRQKGSKAQRRLRGANMCEYYGLPLALIFEELVDMDKPEDKAQEQRPAEAEQEQQSKGTANR